MGHTVVGVMGPGEGAEPSDLKLAEELGGLIADRGWVLLTGGRPVGVMEAALAGAKSHQGLTVGVLPGNAPKGASDAVDIRIVTGMGEARNVINILTSQVVFVCGMSAGTASEVALALKVGRPTILVNAEPVSSLFWRSLTYPSGHVPDKPPLYEAQTANEAVSLAASLLS